MINHVRTLLLNSSAASRPSIGVLGEEVIPTGYQAVSTSVDVEALRGILFGTKPDVLTQNYRAAQYMQLVTSNPTFLEVSDSLDPRISRVCDLTQFPFGAQASVSTGETILRLTGTPVSDDMLGVNYATAKIRLTWSGGSPATCVVVSTDNPGGLSPALTDPIDLGVLGLGVSGQLALPIGGGTAPETWTVTLAARPQRSLVDIYRQLLAQEDLVRRCAGRITDTTTGDTLLNLFISTEPTTTQIAAAAMILALATEAYRLGN